MKKFLKIILSVIIFFLSFLGQVYVYGSGNEVINDSGAENQKIVNTPNSFNVCASSVSEAGKLVLGFFKNPSIFSKEDIEIIKGRIYEETSIWDIIISIIFYILASFGLYKLAKYSECWQVAWFAWIPFLNFYLTFKIAGFPFSMFISYLIKLIVACVFFAVLFFMGGVFFACYLPGYANLFKITMAASQFLIFLIFIFHPYIFYCKRVLCPICISYCCGFWMMLGLLFLPWLAFPILGARAKNFYIRRNLY